jgi:hypothetical protein
MIDDLLILDLELKLLLLITRLQVLIMDISFPTYIVHHSQSTTRST